MIREEYDREWNSSMSMAVQFYRRAERQYACGQLTAETYCTTLRHFSIGHTALAQALTEEFGQSNPTGYLQLITELQVQTRTRQAELEDQLAADLISDDQFTHARAILWAGYYFQIGFPGSERNCTNSSWTGCSSCNGTGKMTCPVCVGQAWQRTTA